MALVGESHRRRHLGERFAGEQHPPRFAHPPLVAIGERSEPATFAKAVREMEHAQPGDLRQRGEPDRLGEMRVDIIARPRHRGTSQRRFRRIPPVRGEPGAQREQGAFLLPLPDIVLTQRLVRLRQQSRQCRVARHRCGERQGPFAKSRDALGRQIEHAIAQHRVTEAAVGMRLAGTQPQHVADTDEMAGAPRAQLLRPADHGADDIFGVQVQRKGAVAILHRDQFDAGQETWPHEARLVALLAIMDHPRRVLWIGLIPRRYQIVPRRAPPIYPGTLVRPLRVSGGAWLMILGGSLYYVVTGVAMVVAGVLLVRQRIAGGWVYIATVALTILWAFYEVGGDSAWALGPRIVAPLVLLVAVLLAMATLTTAPRRGGYAWGGVIGAFLLGVIIFGITGRDDTAIAALPSPSAPGMADPSGQATGQDWPAYGGTYAARRYSPLTEINAGNVGKLEQVWETHTGGMPTEARFQKLYGTENTPLKIGNLLYTCTAKNIIVALDAATGKQVWRFDPKVPDVWIPYT